MADSVFAAGYYGAEELMDTSASARAQINEILSGGRPGWARLTRKMIDSEAPPTEVEIKKAPSFTEVGIFAAIEGG